MRLTCLVLALVTLLATSACNSMPKSASPYPDKFEQALVETYELSMTLDKRVVTSNWERATKDAFELVNMTNHLLQYEPIAGIDQSSDFRVYQTRVEALHFASFKIKQFVDLHKRDDAIEWLDEYITRYNAIASQFGDGRLMTPTPRPRSIENVRYGD